MRAHHRRIKLVHVLPLLLPWFHHVDLFKFERSLLMDILYHCFGVVTETAWTSREEGDATLKEARSGSEHNQTQYSDSSTGYVQSRVELR